MTREEAMRYLLDLAARRGVDVEILASERRDLEVDSLDGRVSEMKQATRAGLGLRVVAEGRVGYAWSEEWSPDALDWALEEAVENAWLVDDTEGFVPEGRALGRFDLLSEGLSAPVEEKVAAARGLESELRRDERFDRAQTVRYMERESRESILSSKGASGGYRTGFSALFGNFVMRHGDSVKQGYGVDASNEFHDLNPAVTAGTMLHRTGRLLGARPLPTGRYRAYLEPEVVAAMLRLLEFALNGKTLVEGKSRLAGKLGRKVASDLITLVDDPSHPDGFGNRPFDAEGTPTGRLVLIEDGVLRSYLHNSATAREAGHETTGHATRGYRSTLGVGPTNLILEPGSGVTLGDGVLLTELMGLHAGANRVTGDFSLQALGLRYEGGESYPVENFVIAGNLFRMLERVTGVGSEPEWDVPTSVCAPLVEIESLSFGGA